MRFRLFLLLLLFALLPAAGEASAPAQGAAFPTAPGAYHDEAVPGVWGKLKHRAEADPFNLLATALFLAAITHTFLTARFTAIAHRYQHRYEALEDAERDPATGWKHARERDRLQFRSQLFHFLGEVEAVFGIWLVPLFLAITVFKGFGSMVHYVSTTSFAEPIFVGVIMAISASRPVLLLAESFLKRVADFGGGTPAAWWFSILSVGPILGSFITEPAAMTICALLLGSHFFSRRPSAALKYATLGLLFVNVSVGGTLTHFAAPPVVMVAGKWGWNLQHMAFFFGWKALVGILIANLCYFAFFRAELISLGAAKGGGKSGDGSRPIPPWITLMHLAFIAWTVSIAHYPALVGLGFLFFVAFTEATGRHQSQLSIRSPLLVGFFLASLVIHGGGQQWWIAPVLGSLSEWPLMLGATVLTAFNDNAAITYLASLVPDFSEPLKYAVVAGAVAGGGLTVIANAPNPAGQSILSRYFEDGVSPGRLFIGALLPTVIMVAVFMLTR